MNENELLRQIRIVLTRHTPDVKRNRSPQATSAQISKIHIPYQSSELLVTEKNDQVATEGVLHSSLGDPTITDKGVPDRTFQNPQFFNQDEMPSRQVNGIRARCQAWLEARLNDGPVPLATVLREAKTLGFSTKAIRLARSHLNVRPLPCLTLTCAEE